MFALVENNAVVRYPYSILDLSRENPNTSFAVNITDAELLEYKMQRVYFSTMPEVIWSQTAEELTPVFNVANQRWEQSWIVRDLTADELQYKNEENSNNIRAQRNVKLAESDWTQVADAPVDKQAWATYRQALRDITQQIGFPSVVDWPVQP
jgi:hypothetical protein